ncbi:hypothetical protein F4859DRAFT_509992 [Xylaria cf. heliscus]|nr:hypothetical protein F4859DRAFT_509992 [Xylaria cf. heliscus]
MVLLTRARATAFASLAALSSVANSQGFYYQDSRLQCGPQYNYQYLGCAETSTAPFAFAPNQWDPAVTADLSRSSIHYDIGDFVNMTTTPYFCAEFCRSHGFKFTALWDRGCHCGNTLNYNNMDGTTVNLQNSIDADSDARCTSGRNGDPYPPCGGDRRENCGSNGGARIFVDPSYPDERTLPALSTLAQGYGPLGCFDKARFPSGIQSITSVNARSTENCFEYCADLGMPYVYMESTTGGITCNCGSEFNKNSAQASTNLDRCTQKCSDATDTTACQGQDCCGTGGGPFPVYANPNLMGCFIPIIPGAANPVTDTPAPNGYNCFPTPQSILGRAPSSVVSYGTRTMSASASFIATARPAAHTFVNYGCWQSTKVANIFTRVFNYTLYDRKLTVDKCVGFCDRANHNFAAVWGTPNTTCACGDAIQSGARPNGAMEDCNQPCTGSARQNCGGDNGPLIYARSNITPNRWADLYSSSWSSTVTYSCTPTAGGGSRSGLGGATSTSSANPTTPAGSTTTASSPTGSSGRGGSTRVGASTISPGGSASGSSSRSGSSATTRPGSSSSRKTRTRTITRTSSSRGSQSGSSYSSSIGNPFGTGSGIASFTGGQFGTSYSSSSGFPTGFPTGTDSRDLIQTYNSTASPTGFPTGTGSGGLIQTYNSSAPPLPTGSQSGGGIGSGNGTATRTGSQYSSGPRFPTGNGTAPTGSGTITLTSSRPSGPFGGATGTGSRSSSVPTSGTTGIPKGSQSGSTSGGTTSTGSRSQSSSAPTGNGVVTPTGGDPGTGTGPNNGNSNGGNGDGYSTPGLPNWVFGEGHAPDDVPCYETTYSWVPGEPTLLLRRDEL